MRANDVWPKWEALCDEDGPVRDDLLAAIELANKGAVVQNENVCQPQPSDLARASLNLFARAHRRRPLFAKSGELFSELLRPRNEELAAFGEVEAGDVPFGGNWVNDLVQKSRRKTVFGGPTDAAEFQKVHALLRGGLSSSETAFCPNFCP